MTFRESLQAAKFRDVPFHVISAETSVGRRGVVHEFAFRDLPFPEDLGKRANEFVVDGFLIGDDYLDKQKLLVAALTTPGSGTLLHPSYGTMQVFLPNPSRLRESFIQQRGMVSFSLVFVEVGEQAQPATKIDTQDQVEASADACYGPMQDDFVTEFSIEGAPGWSLDSLVGEIGRINDVVSSIRDALQFDLSPLSALNFAANSLKANLFGLLATPNALFTELSVQIRGLVSFFDFSAAQDAIFGGRRSASRPIGALLPLHRYGAADGEFPRPAIATTTPIRVQQAANQAAVFNLVARAAVVEAVRSAVYVPFASVEEATTTRDQLYEALDTLILDAPDPVLRVLQDLQVAMVRDITARGADLARLTTMMLPGSLPARVMSYQLYGSGAFADELIARNQVEGTVLHPLFMPAGTPLEVRRV